LCATTEGVAVPGLTGERSKTVENAWQFLKIWQSPGYWLKEEAMAAFASDVAIRYPRGKSARAIGHHWGETGELLDYVTARQRIYIPAYLEFLARPDRRELIDRLREASLAGSIAIWDPDSYNIQSAGLASITDAIAFTDKPFAHAFVVALLVVGMTRTLKARPVKP
jgi:hypothetical protein